MSKIQKTMLLGKKYKYKLSYEVYKIQEFLYILLITHKKKLLQNNINRYSSNQIYLMNTEIISQLADSVPTQFHF